MKIKLDYGARMPNKAHPNDAGFDLFARERFIIPAKGSYIHDTGVHIELPYNTVGFIKSKSGLNVKHGITTDGTIDVGYTGSIIVKLYNHSDTDYEVEIGDKITQLVIVPIIHQTNLDLIEVDHLDDSERGLNGFGSTGR